MIAAGLSGLATSRLHSVIDSPVRVCRRLAVRAVEIERFFAAL